METTFCPWEPATMYFISSNVPELIYYSHFVSIFSALLIASLVLCYRPMALTARLFFLFSALFTVWTLINVNLWATNDPGQVMFGWSLQVLLEPLTYTVAFFLFYSYSKNRLPGIKLQLLVFGLLLPIIILLPTSLNLKSLLLSSCESIEGPIAIYYSYFVNIVLMLLTVGIGIHAIVKQQGAERVKTIIFLIGLLTFLLSFTSGNIISSFTDEWELSQYGLFGMPVFASLIAYSIVKFNTFRIHVSGAYILVIIVWLLVASLIFVDIEMLRFISLVTLLFTTISGFLLIRSVRREVEQKEKLESLTDELAKANKRLKELDKAKSEFVSIASHQLRSPLTSMRGYASMLLEGSYGQLPQKAKEVISRMADSSTDMAATVEDYLDVSRIESGNMKFDYSDFNLRDEVERVVDDKRQEAIQSGLLLLFKTNLNKKGVVHADKGKALQIVHNLINNSMKYTQKGSITVYVHDNLEKDRILVSVQDTGIGMSQEAIDGLFGKFARAKNANSVNIHGTGLGLYVAKSLAEAMGGDITASSSGEGKGSTFTLELPLKM